MVMHLRPGATGASQETLAGKFRPPHAIGCRERMVLREHDEQSLGPQRFRMAIAHRRNTDDEGDVETRFADIPDGVARPSLRNLQIDCRMPFTKLSQQLSEKARCDR